MTPEEILRDAEDMAKNYPGDRLRLTGAEILALVVHVRQPLVDALEKVVRAPSSKGGTE